MENKYIQKKAQNRAKKRITKRSASGEEVIFIFEKVLEGWKTIKIYNTIIQLNPNSIIDKKTTETIATGNCKIYENELSKDQYNYYLLLRQKVYDFHKLSTPHSDV